jgi:hypothetical protein
MLSSAFDDDLNFCSRGLFEYSSVFIATFLDSIMALAYSSSLWPKSKSLELKVGREVNP